MSELKATTVYDAYWNANSVGEGTGIQVYLKSEADKVIAEKDAKIEKLNAIRKVHVEAIESMGAGILHDEEEILHHKYKQCFAMAKYCDAMRGHYLSYEDPKWFWYRKWSERWLELAEKIKEAK